MSRSAAWTDLRSGLGLAAHVVRVEVRVANDLPDAFQDSFGDLVPSSSLYVSRISSAYKRCAQ